MSKIRMIGAAALLSLMLPAYPADIIIESRPEGKNFDGYSEPLGNWLSSNTPPETAKSSAAGLTPQGTAGSRKTVINVESGNAPDQVLATARFKPTITEAGNYHVYVTFPRAANAAPVTVLVKSADGEETKEIAMDGWGGKGRSNADTWVEIGTYEFAPGADNYVELQATGATKAADTRNTVQMYADAVRFSTEPAGSGSGATAPAAAPAAATPSAPAVPLEWKTSIGDARAEASQSNKKVLVFFYSPASTRSTAYEENVLKNPQVTQAISAGYVPVRINMDTERQLAAQLEVFRAGTINIYDATTGAHVAQIGDTPEVHDLVARLK